MIKLTQYGDYFYLYILLLSLIPAIVLGIKGKNIKPYGIVLSIFMVGVIIGVKSVGIVLFIMFLLGEIILINLYLEIRDRTDNKFIYYLALFLSMLPIIITKVSAKSSFGPIGFIGLSYLNFKAIQIIIKIYDGTIKKLSFYFSIFYYIFSTLSSGPIDRYRRFEENLNIK